jgi:YD repeat-containing protein
MLESVSDGTRSVHFLPAAGNLLAGVQDAAGETTGYTYTTVDAHEGLLTQKTWPEGNAPWTQTWDAQARVATQTTPTATRRPSPTAPARRRSAIRATNESTLAHDAGGHLTSSTNPTNRTRLLEYGATGNRTAVEQPLGGRHLRTFDLASESQSSATNAAGETVTYQYTSRSVAPGFTFRELTGIAFPDGRSETYVYDANGNQTSRTDRGADAWTRTFNAHGQALTETKPARRNDHVRVQPRSHPGIGHRPGGRATTFQYDAVKRVARVTRPGGAFRQLGWTRATGSRASATRTAASRRTATTATADS